MSNTDPTTGQDVTVLLVEDDPAVSEVVATALSARGYDVVVARDATTALDSVASREPDVVLLDLGLPDLDGIEVCRRIRRWFPNPVIVLSADGAEDRKVDALDVGADDYVTKPFSMPELLARLRVALRHRRLLAAVVDSTELHVGDLAIDTGAREVVVGGRPLELTRMEYSVLALLARNPGRVLTHGAIIAHVWGGERSGTTESLRVHITNLRKKLGTGPDRPEVITEPGVGYRLVLAAGPSRDTPT